MRQVAAMLAVGRGAPWILAGDLNTEMQDHKKYTAQAIPSGRLAGGCGCGQLLTPLIGRHCIQ